MLYTGWPTPTPRGLLDLVGPKEEVFQEYPFVPEMVTFNDTVSMWSLSSLDLQRGWGDSVTLQQYIFWTFTDYKSIVRI